jgi:hypothetical protein
MAEDCDVTDWSTLLDVAGYEVGPPVSAEELELAQCVRQIVRAQSSVAPL